MKTIGLPLLETLALQENMAIKMASIFIIYGYELFDLFTVVVLF